MSWSYSGTDIGIRLFDACLKAGAPMVFGHGDDREEPFRVLEVGCCEEDWLHHAANCFPAALFTGIDVRTQDQVDYDGRVTRKTADTMQRDVFPPNSFDAIVSLSAIEHIGLGHYGDPKDEHGDSKALANCWHWLKPGGWLYFDVPYDPTQYTVKGTECRVYDDAALVGRLFYAHIKDDDTRPAWREQFVGYCHAKHPDTLITEPTEPVEPFYYVALVWQKA